MTALMTTTTEDTRPAHAQRLASARAYIEQNFHRVPVLEEVAAVARLSRFHFQRQFRRAYGQTPKQVMTELQVAEAQRLLLGGAALAEAASAVGFAHPSHMAMRFKQVVGVPPRRWLKGARQGASSHRNEAVETTAR